VGGMPHSKTLTWGKKFPGGLTRERKRDKRPSKKIWGGEVGPEVGGDWRETPSSKTGRDGEEKKKGEGEKKFRATENTT